MQALKENKETVEILLKTVNIHQTTIAVLERGLKKAAEERDRVTALLRNGEGYIADLTAQLNAARSDLDNERKAREAAEIRLYQLRDEMAIAHRQLLELHQLLMEDFWRRQQTEQTNEVTSNSDIQ